MSAVVLERRGVSAAGVVSGEWIKLTSLRSTVWLLAVTVVVSIGFGLLLASTAPEAPGPVPVDERAAFVAPVFGAGMLFTQLIAAVLGVLTMSGEYSSGMVRSSMTAVPRRTPVLLAKALVLGATVWVVSALSGFGGYLATMPALAERGLDVPLGDPTLLGQLLGGPTYLALVAVFALGIGTLLRSSAGGIIVVIAVILVLPVLVVLLPTDIAEAVTPALLSTAGEQIAGLGRGVLEYWQAMAVAVAWAAGSLIPAALVLKRRDV